MSNVHRFKPRPKAPPPRRPAAWARAAWLPWTLILACAAGLVLIGIGTGGSFIATVLIVLLGAWLHQRG